MSLYSVDEPVLTRMLARPELCLEMIAPDEVEQFELGLKLVDDDGHGFEKSWHGVHYLLTGSAWEGKPSLAYLVKGGTELEWDDSWFEVPPRALTSDQVREWSEALSSVTDEQLRARFNPADMVAQQIYPGFWDRDPERDNLLAWLMRDVPGMRSCLESAAAAGQGMLVVTT